MIEILVTIGAWLIRFLPERAMHLRLPTTPTSIQMVKSPMPDS
jgi:hypothetical protein